jgi:hypothetical protein
MVDVVYESVTIKGDGITLSLLIWRKFKRPMVGIVERILDRQGELAGKVYLDVGDVVQIPIDAPRNVSTRPPVIKLWD